MEKKFDINKDKCKIYALITVLQIVGVELVIFFLLIHINYLDTTSLLVLSIFPALLDIITFVLYYQKLITRRVSVNTNEVRYYIDEYKHFSSTVDNKYINFSVKKGSLKKVRKGLMNLSLKGRFLKTENGISNEVRRLQIPNIINEYDELFGILQELEI